jgi:hypothetical protein
MVGKALMNKSALIVKVLYNQQFYHPHQSDKKKYGYLAEEMA